MLQRIISSVYDHVLGRDTVLAGKRTPWWSREQAAKKRSIVTPRRNDESFPQLKVELKGVLAEYKCMVRVAKNKNKIFQYYLFLNHFSIESAIFNVQRSSGDSFKIFALR